MPKIKGDDIVLEVNTGTEVSPVWNLVVCITEQDLDLQRETIDASSKCGNDQLSGQLTINANFTGFFDTAPTGGAVSMNELMGYILNDDSKQWRMLSSEDDGATYYRQFNGSLTAFNESANSNEPGTFTAGIAVQGTVITEAPTT